MLFQLEGTNTLIFGSMHGVPPGATGWIPRVTSLCAWADEFAAEMLSAHQPAMYSEPVGRSAALLPEDLQKKIRAMWPAHLGPFEKANLPAASLFASVAGTKTDAGVEPLVEQLAGTRTIHELEDAAGFLRGFADIPASQFATAVRIALKRSAEYRETKLQLMYDQWQAEDREGLRATILSDMPPAFVDAAFKIRNQAWAPKVAALAKRPQKLLVCVGAGHLCGPDNLLEFLAKDHGFKATEILS